MVAIGKGKVDKADTVRLVVHYKADLFGRLWK